MDDKQILDLYFARKEQAIAETAKKYGKYCFSIARNILGNIPDAEETVNDTYIGAWNSIPPHRPGILSTYLGKITRRLALKRWTANRTQKRGGGEVALALEELAGCIPSDFDVESRMETAELTQILNKFVRNLPKAERDVFLCRYWYLDSIEAIARRFDFSQSKVKSMLSRTRKKLCAHLQKEGYL